MDNNFEGKYRAYDPISHRDSQIETRLSEVKTRILRSAERKLLNHLHFKVANIKIADSKIASLDIKEDVESGVPLFDGKVEISATYLQENQIRKANFTIAIVENLPEIVAEEVQKALENSSEIATTVAEIPDATTVKASLGGFKLVDNGGKYLKVYHTAAYGDLEPIGAVSKDEYNTCATKAELLKTMLQDEAVSWPATVEFTEEFIEPAVTIKAEEQPVYKVKADPELDKVTAEASHSVSHLVPDTFRFQVEAHQNSFNDLQRRIEQRAIVALTDSLKANRMGNFKVKKAETSYDTENHTGKVVIHTELLDGRDRKVVPFEVQISGESMTLPTKEQVVSLLKDTKVEIESIEAPAEVIVEAVAKLEVIKEAHANAPLQFGYQEVLRIPKEFLPASLKEGDIIEADGLRYKLVSKSEGQLDKNKESALHWMFERVHEGTAGKENKPIYRVDY